MRKCIVSMASLCLAMSVMAQEPLWDLKKDKLGEVKGAPSVLADGTVVLDEASSFAVPNSAFPDPKNFTVSITVKYSDLSTKAVCESLLAKEGQEDSGFGIGISYNVHHKRYTTRVNRLYATPTSFANYKDRKDVGKPSTYTIFARDGMVSFYREDIPGPKIFLAPVPCNSPLWVGLGREDFGNLEILDLKVYGKDYEYKSPKEKYSDLVDIVRPGIGWAIDLPRKTHGDLPLVLIYGDSISWGYRSHLRNFLSGKAYVEHWSGCVSTPKDASEKTFASAAGSAKYEAIVFNNGLHSLLWTEKRVSDKEIFDVYKTMVRGFKKGAPQAKLFYLNTTPVSTSETTPRSIAKDNEVVKRLNRIAEQVMKEENVEVIDMYSILFPKVAKMTDGYHWPREIYGEMAAVIHKKIAELPCMK